VRGRDVLGADATAMGTRGRDRRALVAPLLATSGFVAVHLYFWAHTGNVFAFFTAERRGWHQGLSNLGSGRLEDIRSVVRSITDGTRPDWNHLVPLAGLVVFVGAFVLLVRWRPPLELVAYTAGLGFFAFTSTHVGFEPRVVMASFPLSMVLGVKLRGSPWFALALGASAALLALLAVVSVSTLYITP
jgi:hypothetical protein